MDFPNTLDELVEARDYVAGQVHDLHPTRADEELAEDEQTRFDEGIAYVAKADELIARHEKLENIARNHPGSIESGFGGGAPQVIRRVAKPDDVDVRTASPSELRDVALGLVERDVATPSEQENAERLARRGGGIARHMVRFGTEVYREAFAKMATGRAHELTPEETRAVAVGTNTQGGHLVPTHLDPTIILTNSGNDSPVRNISSVVSLGPDDGNTWNGVSSAGVTASWDAELAEVSDDAPELAKPTIPTHKASAFIPYSIEAEHSISTLEAESRMLFADARDRLEGAAFATGSGSGQPTGIFTALDANTNVELSNTTAATLGAVDIYAVYAAVPARDRKMASWLMSVSQANTIRQLGTTDANFTVDLTADGVERILGRTVYEDSNAPGTPSSTTQVENWLVIGNFARGYKVVDKIGFSVEFIPHLFATGANRPSGSRGLYAYWKVGADSVADTAFRLLQDKTSA